MLKIGHRGACGHAPENTLASMRKALALGVDGIEFDIQLSRDGVPVVIHDDTLERTTNGTGAVADFTLAELKQLDAGDGEKIPTLAEIFALCKGQCQLYIELKSPHCVPAVADEILCQTQTHGWPLKDIFVCAFDHRQLVAIAARIPGLQTCALIAGIPVSLAAIASEAGAMAINPAIHHMDALLVADAHARGLKVVTWTANSPADIAKAKAYGVDGIISNYPDRIPA